MRRLSTPKTLILSCWWKYHCVFFLLRQSVWSMVILFIVDNASALSLIFSISFSRNSCYPSKILELSYDLRVLPFRSLFFLFLSFVLVLFIKFWFIFNFILQSQFKICFFFNFVLIFFVELIFFFNYTIK
jgi:hypothetical protein